MKRKSAALVLALVLGACLLCPALAAQVSFSDVPGDAWYAEDVAAVAQADIVNGRGDGTFAPEANVTLAETVKLAAVVHAKVTGASYTFPASQPWYQVYENYLSGITGQGHFYYNEDPGQVVDREQFAQIMSAGLLGLTQAERNRNEVEDGGIPDLYSEDAHADVYALYRAGILTGSDAYGTFHPTSSITRAEVAAIVRRFIDPSARKSITLTRDSASAAPTPAGADGDQTSYTPPGWSWTAQGTEGYGLARYTSGKYLRPDGKAVLYIDSSDSSDFFRYWIYVLPEGAHQEAYTVPDGGDPDDLGFAEVLEDGSARNNYSLLQLRDTGYQAIEISVDWIDELFFFYPDPSGTYLLVREKTP